MDNYSEDITNTENSLNEVTLLPGEISMASKKCYFVKNLPIKNRMYLNLISVYAGKRILMNYSINSSYNYGLQEAYSVLSKWDISELFVEDCRISIRTIFNGHKLFIPKKHEKYGLFPDIFMFVKFDNNKVKLLGFILPDELDKTNSDDNYYYVSESQLKTLGEVKEFIFNVKYRHEDINILKNERVQIIKYLDGIIEDKIKFFSLLSNSIYLREQLIKYEKSQIIYNKLIEKENLIKEEIEKDIINISKLADAFIQSKNQILKSSEEKIPENADNFKLECTRANLEKLFNSQSSYDSAVDNIQNQSNEDVMDCLLSPSDSFMKEERLPISAVLNAFKFFGILMLIILIVSCWICYLSYTNTSSSDIWLALKKYYYIIQSSISKIINIF